ncbi:probable serine hydrolase [Homarus americanus]|uniref:probable serine hydrolase n=1 Tax=Homarus americanus TaxID=6706 RepID=UPI001C478104|nr:probable serine hydrolase [Homarus americanus]XP_042238166.1 probable serine hydrolase [Homarus americanus]XP_042238176.1 probable serine hydrolase [Homarus americanus]XP_042238185.1 probable serine hydrolase [Homarus americanus]
MSVSPVHMSEIENEQSQDPQGEESKIDLLSPTKRHQRIVEDAWEWEEIEIDIGWGTLRGKARGSGPRYLLGLHGWLDNANTFDLIAPFFPKDMRIVSLDLPGHGRSDHFPPGFIYDPRGYLGAVKKAVISLGWNHFTLLGHSMGAVVGIMYTSVFPEDIEAFICLDMIKPWSYPPEKLASRYKKSFLQYFDNEKNATQPALVYDEEELVRKTMEGSKSLDDRGARILLQRGARRAENGKGLILTRDLRAKVYFVGFISSEMWMGFAKSITCPLLLIKATESDYHHDSPELIKAMLSAFKQDCKYFCFHEMPGKHHIHLTHPTPVGELILDFLDECKSFRQSGAIDYVG